MVMQFDLIALYRYLEITDLHLAIFLDIQAKYICLDGDGTVPTESAKV